jgi:hypothetical protein
METARFLQEADVKLQKEDYEWAIGRWVMCGKWRARQLRGAVIAMCEMRRYVI